MNNRSYWCCCWRLKTVNFVDYQKEKCKFYLKLNFTPFSSHRFTMLSVKLKISVLLWKILSIRTLALILLNSPSSFDSSLDSKIHFIVQQRGELESWQFDLQFDFTVALNKLGTMQHSIGSLENFGIKWHSALSIVSNFVFVVVLVETAYPSIERIYNN